MIKLRHVSPVHAVNREAAILEVKRFLSEMDSQSVAESYVSIAAMEDTEIKEWFYVPITIPHALDLVIRASRLNSNMWPLLEESGNGRVHLRFLSVTGKFTESPFIVKIIKIIG